MGRLSPRTRNAQVKLYQDKEVDFLVATDAIGMGLNMDVDHVAFANLSKFDGRRPRRLTPSEVAQIAGRAGRGMRDGTFGTTGTCPPLEDEMVRAVEGHSFEPLEQLYWRNAELDLSSVDTLLESLQQGPPRAGLVRGPDATDLETLAALARETEIRDLARGRRLVRLLWETCGIPDFRKLADDTHTRLCARVFTHLARDGRVPTAWLDAGIAGLMRTEGDIDTLMQRLSGMRVWSYIAARTDWVTDAPAWQSRTREVEDLLSDALHERQTARFVDRRAAHLLRKLDETDGEQLLSAVTARNEVVVEGHPVGHVEGFQFVPDPVAEGPEKRMVLRAARRALRAWMPLRVHEVEAADDAVLGWTAQHRLTWSGVEIGRLRPGASFLQPLVEVLDSEYLDGPARERIRARLDRYVRSRIGAELAPLFAAQAATAADPALRGPMHRVLEAGGVVAGATEADVPPALRGPLKAVGIRAGRFALFLPAALKPRAAAMRAALWALRRGVAAPVLPAPGLVSCPPVPGWPEGFALAMGWVAAGPVLVRLDVAERVVAELAFASRRARVAVPTDLASRLSVAPSSLAAVLQGLGLRMAPPPVLDAGQFGPPAPLMLMPPRPRRPPPARPTASPPRPDNPFAALAVLRR
jgi:ATP-dependent RNA helicase SUPV3L1/SUV3